MKVFCKPWEPQAPARRRFAPSALITPQTLVGGIAGSPLPSGSGAVEDLPQTKETKQNAEQTGAQAPWQWGSERRSGGRAAKRGAKAPASSESGMALVITLLMLAIITFMAIAFLVLTRGQRLSVAGSTDAALARLAADSAQERATAELVSAMLATTNEFNYDLLVSTNYINPAGFFHGVSSPTNVNFDHKAGSLNVPLGADDVLQNLTNLLYNPRVPVWMVTNSISGRSEFRFYYDANRNSIFDPTGWLGVTNSTGKWLGTSNSFVGDPQWIGALQFPDRPHSADNPFLFRYAYLVVPAGKTLDLNYIYNYAKVPNPRMTRGADGFLRNQGVGTWEINLAAFLVDLNPSLWWSPNANPYKYHCGPTDYMLPNTGIAFEDALSLLKFRYSGTALSLPPVKSIFGVPGANGFGNDGIDGYSAGPPMLAGPWASATPDNDAKLVNARGWSGADNTNHFFTPQDLFDPTKTSQDFVNRLTAIAGPTNYSAWDRTTFYRLLSQLGTDSAGEPTGTINLNYDNRVFGTNQIANSSRIVSATNFVPWQPVVFFTNAADRLLTDAGFKFTSGSIQIYPTNYYSASVHRLLQLAANIYDATTNQTYKTPGATNGFPSVFRPTFLITKTNGLQVWINRWEDLPRHDIFVTSPPQMLDLSDTNALAKLNRPEYFGMFYGIPLVIGAKKGFPNFNELEMQTAVTVTRKLEFRKRKPSDFRPYQTNQMYTISISNSFGIEAWNSYSNVYPRNLRLLLADDMTAWITKTNGQLLPLMVNGGLVRNSFSNYYAWGFSTNIPAKSWRGFLDKTPFINGLSFITPVPAGSNTFYFLPPASYSSMPGNEHLVVPLETKFEVSVGFPVPQWALKLRTRLRFILYDVDAGRIVDYVNLASNDDPVDLNRALSSDGVVRIPYRTDCTPGSMWVTNRDTAIGPTYGILNQIAASLGTNDNGVQWTVAPVSPTGLDRVGAENYFRTNLLGWVPLPGGYAGPFALTNLFYAPYAASRTIYFHTSWQANDPLVHYTIGDLTPLVRTNRFVLDRPDATTLPNIGAVNTRYQPWGQLKYSGNTDPKLVSELALKDPLVTRSDDWEFPTNKFPNVGWLGRVHRGTPWQTVYLKSSIIDLTNWMKWSGNGGLLLNAGQIDTNLMALGTIAPDAVFTHPTNDWRLMDLFTTAFNDNAARGRLSVNQTNLAAWSAVLSGVVVLTNLSGSVVSPPQYAPFVVSPAGVYDPLAASNTWPAIVKIVSAINNVRASTNIFPRRVFDHTGDILAVPELTVRSPFLNTNGVLGQYSINDAAYERIPQQILGLLSCDHEPRFVIYSYGQALKPAPHSLITGNIYGGRYLGLCTNYQITAEVATRAVVRLEGLKEIREHRGNKVHAVIESFNVLPPD